MERGDKRLSGRVSAAGLAMRTDTERRRDAVDRRSYRPDSSEYRRHSTRSAHQSHTKQVATLLVATARIAGDAQTDPLYLPGDVNVVPWAYTRHIDRLRHCYAQQTRTRADHAMPRAMTRGLLEIVCALCYAMHQCRLYLHQGSGHPQPNGAPLA